MNHRVVSQSCGPRVWDPWHIVSYKYHQALNIFYNFKVSDIKPSSAIKCVSQSSAKLRALILSLTLPCRWLALSQTLCTCWHHCASVALTCHSNSYNSYSDTYSRLSDFNVAKLTTLGSTVNMFCSICNLVMWGAKQDIKTSTHTHHTDW